MAHVGYIRVSTHDQNNSRQLVDINLDKTFTEVASGKDRKRPALDMCLTYLREGDVLHVHSIDRLARNLADLQRLIAQLMQKKVTVHFHNEHLIFSTEENSNPFSALQLQILGAFAEFERSMSRERQREGLLAAKKRGQKLGRPAKITPKIREEILVALASGTSPKDLAKKFSVSLSSIYKIS